ncbi:MlaD family protein [Patulibacter sp. SYSU D01012]|uniref:MlaD family protein n=1 Tax=Patulibacter sp. SYSU D01012 TaxID=2817381 RepID=UPI001B3061F0
MIKTIPTLPRLIAMIGFALFSFGALLFLWISFGGPVPLSPKGYRFQVAFPEAAQLAQQADVRISGVTVGKVVALETVPGNQTRATIQLDEKYAPIPKAARATLRSKTLLGETFVELAPNRSAGTGPLPENGKLAASAVEPTVELDELLRTFDDKTRAAFRTWMQTQAAALNGRGDDLNAALGEFPGLIDELSELSATIDAQGSAVTQSVSGTADVFEALTARQGELRRLVSEGDKTFRTIGQRNKELAAVFEALPAFEREASRTLPAVTRLGDRAVPVVERLQPAATQLAKSFDAVNRLTPDLEAFMKRLDPVVSASKQGLPAFDRILDQMPPVLDAFVPFTRTVNPLLRYLGQNKQDFTSFVANVSAATQRGLSTPRAGRMHEVRASVTLSPQGMGYQQYVPGQSRSNPYMAPGGMKDLATGLKTLDSRTCGNTDPLPPTETNNLGGLERLLPSAFRTTGRDSPRPGCVQQGTYPGFSTVFPQLKADPPAKDAPSTSDQETRR